MQLRQRHRLGGAFGAWCVVATLQVTIVFVCLFAHFGRYEGVIQLSLRAFVHCIRPKQWCHAQEFNPARPLNAYLGTCLTNEWVGTVGIKLGVSNTTRQAPQNRLVHPFLHKALRVPRFRVSVSSVNLAKNNDNGRKEENLTVVWFCFKVEDPRTNSLDLFNSECKDALGNAFGSLRGVGEVILPNGTVESWGTVNGSVVISLNQWNTHSLSSLVFAIVASEIYGYPVAFVIPGDYTHITEHMSSVGRGRCAPVHVDVEVWEAGFESLYSMYPNESYMAGSAGYFGRSGLYTTARLVEDGQHTSKSKPSFSADFWMDYALNDELISALNASYYMNNSDVYIRNSTSVCPNSTTGCLNSCSKTYACTLREEQGKECMVVIHNSYFSDTGYLQAVMANLAIPTYFCFLGSSNKKAYAVSCMEKNAPVAFYHYEPDAFFFRYPDVFERVFLPNDDPKAVLMSTGTFGENGYGQQTNNPVRVDFPSQNLKKYGATVITKGPNGNTRIGELLAHYSLSELHINELLSRYISASHVDDVNLRYFTTACNWVRDHYDVWKLWLDPLPICKRDDVLVSCSESSSVSGKSTISNMSFVWKEPHPDDPYRPYKCDGGITELPEPILTRRTCGWYLDDPMRFTHWLQETPFCDKYFYECSVGECDGSASREIVCSWIRPDPKDHSKPSQCFGGSLPQPTTIDCDYTPTTSPAFMIMVVIAITCAMVDILAMIVLHRFRTAPTIWFSQPELMELMLAGGLLMCVYVFVQGGQATDTLCSIRKVVLYLIMTAVFGTLCVKLWGTYQLSICASEKRHQLRESILRRSFTVVLLLFLVDVVVLVLWFLNEPPRAVVTLVIIKTVTFTGEIPQKLCSTEPSKYEFVLMVWNLSFIVLVVFLSFLNRKVRFDYGESSWLLMSSVVGTVLTFLILLLDVLANLSAVASFLFHSCCFLLDTFMLLAFLIVPKFMRVGNTTATEDRNTSSCLDESTSLDVMSFRASDLLTQKVGPTTPEDGARLDTNVDSATAGPVLATDQSMSWVFRGSKYPTPASTEDKKNRPPTGPKGAPTRALG